MPLVYSFIWSNRIKIVEIGIYHRVIHHDKQGDEVD
jgi:hypothetical protein